jgi:AraC-like DNA-binding protein
MDYTISIQNIITYIDQHLCEQLTLEDVSRMAGFSRYHFLRIFKRETGIGIRDYIKTRRMYRAVDFLLTTELSVMDIAIILQFDSQEAFTRAFKREYSLPPGQYRRAMMRLINVKKEPVMKLKQIIPGWIITGSMLKLYSVLMDSETNYNGAKSIIIKNKSDMLEAGAFSTIMQQFKAANYIGKRVRFSGYVKSQDIKELGGLWMRINSTTADILKIDNMQDRPIIGDTDWTYHSVVLDVPENSAIINIGILLNGTGKLWAAGLSFEVVDKSVDTTDVDLSSGLPEIPVNLSFDNN